MDNNDNNDKYRRMYSISLMLCGFCTIVLIFTRNADSKAFEIMRMFLGFTELIACPILVYSTVKIIAKGRKQ